MTKKQEEYLDEIYTINERMIRLVFDMLNALRFEGGTVDIKKEQVSIDIIYDLILTSTAAAAQRRHIILRNALGHKEKELVINTDPKLFEIILECFVSNAIGYSSSDQEVILDAKEESAAVVFFVKDSGIGIPKDEQKKVFERFYRAANAKKLKPDGTGLGLYISSMLAEKIGAEILFDSEEGKGTTFYLRVPKKVG